MHGYGAIDPDIVWRIIHTHLPLLLREVRALLGDDDGVK
ncbi:MAG TPA: HepT-like ribonuclease domain-containing protein [Thermoanaerobaculia bacterium]|nr:HepT-like ribonuclease domain-containing protein [Thermoanaerobaculia bacterium]